MEGGEAEEEKKQSLPAQNLPQNSNRPAAFSEQKEARGEQAAVYPSQEWMDEWKKTLNIGNVKACVSHTYNKAMHIRN